MMDRKGFIGGSDCTKIMRGDWLELWQIKTGRKESEDLSDNIAVQMGVHTEDFNLRWFERQSNSVLKNHQKEFEATIGDIPVRGTVDAMVANDIVEAKHTYQNNTMSNLVAYYMPQVQLYAHAADADGIYLTALFGNNSWEATYIDRDEEYFNSMWAVVSDFWGYVVRDEEPLGVDVPTLSIDAIPLDKMVARDASTDNAFVDAAVTYINGYEHNRTFENAKKDLKAMVADNEREVYCDHLTVKRDKRGSLRITKR
jgi:hypothetical protein